MFTSRCHTFEYLGWINHIKTHKKIKTVVRYNNIHSFLLSKIFSDWKTLKNTSYHFKPKLLHLWCSILMKENKNGTTAEKKSNHILNVYLENHIWFIYFYIQIIWDIEVFGKDINRFHSPFTQSNLWPDFALVKMKLHIEDVSHQLTPQIENMKH